VTCWNVSRKCWKDWIEGWEDFATVVSRDQFLLPGTSHGLCGIFETVMFGPAGVPRADLGAPMAPGALADIYVTDQEKPCPTQ
jgi:hypothetical protein